MKLRGKNQNTSYYVPKKQLRPSIQIHEQSQSIKLYDSPNNSYIILDQQDEFLPQQHSRDSRKIQMSSRDYSLSDSLEQQSTRSNAISQSPSPTNNILHKSLCQMGGCQTHMNQQSNIQTIYILNQERCRYIRYLCCNADCESVLLCNECNRCNHNKKLDIKDFFDQPILAFLHEQQSSFLLKKVVQQQSLLFNKIKDQVEYSKSLLKEYFNKLIEQITKSSNQIQELFQSNTDSHLQSIRVLLDSIQNTSSVYKDHFESTTLDALDSDCSADTLKGCISNFLRESDNPSDQLTSSVTLFQEYLNSIPQLNPTNMKSAFRKVFDTQDFTYKYLINDKAQ